MGTQRHTTTSTSYPSRSARSNGYRDDDALHVVRLLRSQRLAALGVPLDEVRSMLTQGDSQAFP